MTFVRKQLQFITHPQTAHKMEEKYIRRYLYIQIVKLTKAYYYYFITAWECKPDTWNCIRNFPVV